MKKILIVDDEAMMVQVLRTVLEDHGYLVASAMDPVQGLIQASDEQPQLIILDIMMPAGGGIEAYKRLRQIPATKNIPIIFLTGVPLEEIQINLASIENVTVIQKPFQQSKLIRVIEGQIGKSG